jgi:hypothetical protein
MSEEEFWAMHNIDPFILASALFSVSGDEQEALRIILATQERAG